MNYPDSLSFEGLWWDMTQGLLFPQVALSVTFRKLETAVSDHIAWAILFSRWDVEFENRENL